MKRPTVHQSCAYQAAPSPIANARPQSASRLAPSSRNARVQSGRVGTNATAGSKTVLVMVSPSAIAASGGYAKVGRHDFVQEGAQFGRALAAERRLEMPLRLHPALDCRAQARRPRLGQV